MTTSIPARAGEARPSRAEITPGASPIDRSSCPASRHGTASAAKNYRCSCPDARRARGRAEKRRKNGMPSDPFVPAVGTTRRIRALQARGFTAERIAGVARLSTGFVRKLGETYRPRIRAHNAERIRLTYEDMTRWPEPPGPYAGRQRRNAARDGWARPEHWADANIDDPAAVSDLAYQRNSDRPLGADAVWLASPAGGNLDNAAIAKRLDVNPDEVTRLLRAVAIASGKSDLTDDQVYEIRARYIAERTAGRLDRQRLRDDYGLSRPGFNDLLTGRARPYLGLTDLIGDSPYRNNARNRANPPRRGAHQLTAVATSDDTNHDQVHPARPGAITNGAGPKLAGQGAQPREHRRSA